MNLLKVIKNKRFENWEVCKSCGGKVVFIMPEWYEEIIFSKMGTLTCTNCGKKEVI